MTEYEKQFFKEYGNQYVITLGQGYFEGHGYPNRFTGDWQLAYKYKNIRTIKQAIKKLTEIHGKGFGYKKINDFMEV